MAHTWGRGVGVTIRNGKRGGKEAIRVRSGRDSVLLRAVVIPKEWGSMEGPIVFPIGLQNLVN